MAKQRHVRNTRGRVQARSNKGRTSKEPHARKHPEARLWFDVVVAGYRVPVFLIGEIPGESLGIFYPDVMEIYIQDGMQPDMTGDTLLHELMHTISTLCLTQEHRLSEIQVNALATHLRDTLNRNPHLQYGVK